MYKTLFKSVIHTLICTFILTGCTTTKKGLEFDPKTCLDNPPKSVPGLQILQGPRTEQNIALDMHPTYCNGQVMLKRMNDNGQQVNEGTITFKVTVEYTGEVISVKTIQTDIQSPEFVKNVSDMIMDSDFTPWQRHEPDAEFIYPMIFTHWWHD